MQKKLNLIPPQGGFCPGAPLEVWTGDIPNPDDLCLIIPFRLAVALLHDLSLPNSAQGYFGYGMGDYGMGDVAMYLRYVAKDDGHGRR